MFVKKVIFFLYILCIAQCFSFEDLFGGNSKEDAEDNNMKSDSSSECPDFKCPDGGACVKPPMDCPCWEGYKKCYTNDWYVCVSQSEECPEESSVERKDL